MEGPSLASSEWSYVNLPFPTASASPNHHIQTEQLLPPNLPRFKCGNSSFSLVRLKWGESAYPHVTWLCHASPSRSKPLATVFLGKKLNRYGDFNPRSFPRSFLRTTDPSVGSATTSCVMATDTEGAERKAPRTPWLLESRSSSGFILATVCVAIFTVGIHWVGAPVYATLTEIDS